MLVAQGTSMNSEEQTAGIAAASADLESTLTWSGVTGLLDCQRQSLLKAGCDRIAMLFSLIWRRNWPR